MGNGADGDAASASGRRCPKHPSQPPFTGFCSACLLDRLHATNLVLASPQPPPSLPSLDLDLEAEDEPTATAGRTTEGGRTTLLRLFQLEDHEEQEQSKAAPSSSSQDPPPDLQRKRSLRQSCSEWIACCDTSTAAANHSSFLPSRQSLDASCSTAAAAPAPPAADAPCTTTNGFAVVERRTASLRVWAIKDFLTKPAGHLLNRSFSESSRSRYAHHPSNGATIARSSSSSQSQVIRRNGSLSVSSTGMGSSEISLPDDSLAHHCRPRLKNRLHWLRRSRSVHYSSPTSLLHAGFTPFRSRSSSTRSAADRAQQPSRRLNLNLFAAGFFGTQRHQH
ncbi:hypothetical protein QOZ80_2AG0098450 [Eleusine coracana subsp. coracana]|nr:hypothetical protein QOZ80_2AG0098450 [Eleusine coracana subsp. coracana]